MSGVVVQCQSFLVISHCYGEELRLQCRRERGHDGNHSSNTFDDGNTVESTEGPVVFRIDWRTNDGVVYQRYPKREGG